MAQSQRPNGPCRGRDALRASPMMAHLLDALEAGRDIGHYGRLTFTIVARHFLDEDELVALLADQPELHEEHAIAVAVCGPGAPPAVSR